MRSHAYSVEDIIAAKEASSTPPPPPRNQRLTLFQSYASAIRGFNALFRTTRSVNVSECDNTIHYDELYVKMFTRLACRNAPIRPARVLRPKLSTIRQRRRRRWRCDQSKRADPGTRLAIYCASAHYLCVRIEHRASWRARAQT